MVASGLTRAKASAFLSTIIGTQVVANALHDTAEYDRAPEGMLADQTLRA